MKPFRPPARGFSLIEMVAAFLVFALGIGVLMQTLAASMHSARQSSDYTMAALRAQSLLDTVGIGEPIQPGQSSGNFDEGYTWQMNIQQVDPSAVESQLQSVVGAGNSNTPPPNQTSAGNAGIGGGMQNGQLDLYQVDLTVSWGGRFGNQPRTAVFSTLRTVNSDLTKNGVHMPAPRFGGGAK
ncbi:MAG: prepilin-type N-terminal cleavage/methylation domain-containing protein [Rhodanobacter sp.]|jgi:general secretion pathway protein I|nr:prepilin-type N-terminal cleavage/methylation domain-containing protein [Rhodanobacter sp.]